MKDFRCGFSRKQINVIFASWKQGKINLTENQMKKLYDYADYYSYWSNGKDTYDCIKTIIDGIFNNDYDLAQTRINILFNVYLKGVN